MNEFDGLSSGKPKLMGIKRAIEEADRAKDEDYSFLFRYEYIEESTFWGDHFDSVLMFPELLAKFDAMGERGYKFASMMLCAYEWILQDSTYFYQVSLDALDNFFKDYIKRAQLFGKSSKMYLLLVMERMRFIERSKDFTQELQLFYDATRNGMTLYELHELLKFELCNDNLEVALKYSEVVFYEGEKEPQGEVPGKTYGYFADYHLQRGEHDEAAKYADKMLPHMIDNGNPIFFDEYFT